MPFPRASASRPAIVLTLVLALLATLGPAVPGLATDDAGAEASEGEQAPGDEAGTDLPGYTPPPKPDRIELTPGDSPTDFTVKFAEGTDVRLRQGRFASRAGAGVGELNRILNARPRVGAERVLRASEAAVTQQRRRAEQRSGRPQADLNLLYSFSVDAADAEELMNELNALDVVEYVAPEPAAVSVPAMPGGAVLAQTGQSSGDFRDKQTYRREQPHGIDANYANSVAVPGGRGENVKVFDLEWDWRQSHEDLTKINGRLLANGTPAGQTQSARNHGTGVMGVLVGDANNFGVTGIVPDAAPRMVNVQNTERGFDIVNAVVRAIADSSPGDVLLIEVQVAGPNSTSSQTRWAPIEWYEPAFTAISIAVSHGLTVIVPAGNGLEGGNEGENLDGTSYVGRFDRSVRDSGAIFVGAGSVQGCNQWSPTQRLRRLPYSNYGSRVDVQAAGECVATTGGWAPSRILQGPPAYPENRWYTEGFSGTSSAAAIIAGAAASVSSIAQERGIDPLTSPEVRALLQRGARAQQGSTAQNIGPQPDLKQAITVLDHMQICAGGGDDWEPNGTIFEATPLRLSQVVDGVICAGERDHFAVQLEAGQQLTVDLRFTRALGDLHMRLLDINGSERVGAQEVSGGRQLTYPAGTTGTYFIEVSGDPQVVNAYTRLVATVPICSPPGPAVDGELLTEGAAVKGIICGATPDRYSVDLVSDIETTIALSATNEFGALALRLVDPWGDQIEVAETVDDEARITYAPVVSGSYTVEVSPIGGTKNRYALEAAGEPHAPACDRWASANADDATGDGSFANPVFSLGALAASLTGEETTGCLWNDGVYDYDLLTETVTVGRPGADPFRLRSVPGERASIRGPVEIGADHLVLEHLDFIGWPDADPGEPLIRIAGDRVAFQHNDVTHGLGTCVLVTGTDGSLITTSLLGNRIRGCGTADESGADHHGIHLADTSGVQISHNLVHGNADRGLQIGPPAGDVLVVRNVFDRNGVNVAFGYALQDTEDLEASSTAIYAEDAVVRENIITDGIEHQVTDAFPDNFQDPGNGDPLGNLLLDNCIHPGEDDQFESPGYEAEGNVFEAPGYSAPDYQLPVDSLCAGRGPASIQPVAPVPPTAPQAMSATPGNQRIDVTWAAPASPGSEGVTDYTVRLLPGSTEKSVPAGQTAASFTGLTNGKTYDVAVRAESGVEAGAWAVVGNVTPRTKPGMPTNVVATPHNGAIHLSWQPPSDNGGVDLASHVITVSDDGQGQTLPAAVTSITLTGLTNGNPYTITIHSVNAAGLAGDQVSRTATPYTVPAAPRNVAASTDDRQITVTWSPPESDGGSSIIDYRVTVAGQSKPVPAGQPRTATFTGLTNGTTYTATVTARNAAGNGPASSVQATPTAPDSGTPPPGATEPGLPRTVRATPADRAIDVTWRQPLSDGGSPITQYLITATPVADLAAGAEARTISVPGDARRATVPELLNGVAYEVRVAARNAVGIGGTQSAPSPVTPGLTAEGVHRIAGPNRFATAAEISRATFPDGAAVAYVATGTNYPDALAGGAAAALAGGPVLLVAPDFLPPETAEELARVGADQIIVLGGTSAVSASVEAQLAELAPVVRMAGDNRFDTAAEISRAAFPDGAPVAFVATGTNYPDALAGGAAAAEAGGPVLLVAPELLPSGTADELVRLAPERIYVLGGASAVPEAIAAQLAAIAPVTRLAGPNRFATADQIAQEIYPGTVPVTYVATGENFPDALAGSAAAGFSGGPVLLVNQALVPLDTESALDRLQPPAIYVLGGENAVSAEVFATLEAR